MPEDSKKVGEAERAASEAAKEAPQSFTQAPGLAPTGAQQAFRNITRQLSDEHLSNSGVQKLILSQLDEARGDLEATRGYVARFHEMDKRAAILDEKLKAITAVSLIFNTCIGIGGVLVGLAFSMQGYQAFVIGIIGLGLFLVPVLCRKSLK